MCRHLKNVRFVMIVVAGLSLANHASAGPTVPHKERCSGTITSVVPTSPLPTMFGAGSGVATHMGKYKFDGSHNFNPLTGQILNGQYVNTAADGSTIAGTYSGTFTPIAPNVFRFNVKVLYLKGTGRLAGVTGVADVVAVVNMNTLTFTYETVGTWTLP
jgi:hypothetical protein